MQHLMYPPSKYAQRGDILQALSGKTEGDYYLLVRTMGGCDQDFLGINKNGTMRYAYNLVNLSTKGSARQTEVERQFLSLRDGITTFIPIADLECHYDLDLKVVTDEVTIAPKVVAAIKAEEPKSHTLQMDKVFMSMMGGGNVVPLFAADNRTVLAYVIQP